MIKPFESKVIEGVTFDDANDTVTEYKRRGNGGEREKISIYTNDEYAEKLSNRTAEEIGGDKKAGEVFIDAESSKLDSAVEQSSNPEKSKKFKKALKTMTVGIVMLTAVLGSSAAAAKGESDFMKTQSKQFEVAVSSVNDYVIEGSDKWKNPDDYDVVKQDDDGTEIRKHQKTGEEITINKSSAAPEWTKQVENVKVDGDFIKSQQTISDSNDYEDISQQNGVIESRVTYQYDIHRNYEKAFNILSEQEQIDFEKQQKDLDRTILSTDLKKFYVYTSKPSKNTQYDTRQIVFKYGIDKVVNILENTYLGISEDGNERQIYNKDDFMKFIGMGLSRKGKFLKKTMYNLAENLADDGQVFNDFVDKMRDLKYSKAIQPTTFAPEEMRFFLDNPNELTAYIKTETTVGAEQLAELTAKYGKNRNLQPKWSNPLPSEMLRMLESE